MGTCRYLKHPYARDIEPAWCHDTRASRYYGRGSAIRAQRGWIFTGVVDVLTELIWRVLSEHGPTRVEGKRWNKSVYQLSFRPHHRLTCPHQARRARGAVVRPHRPQKVPTTTAHEGHDVLDHGLPRVVRGPVVIRAAAHGPCSPLCLGPGSGVLVARAPPFLPNNAPWGRVRPHRRRLLPVVAMR